MSQTLPALEIKAQFEAFTSKQIHLTEVLESIYLKEAFESQDIQKVQAIQAELKALKAKLIDRI